MKIIFVAITIFLISNSILAQQDKPILIEEGQYVPMTFNYTNLTQSRIFRTKPIQFSEVDQILVTGQDLKTNLLTMRCYTINDDGEQTEIKNYTNSQGMSQLEFGNQQKGSSAQVIILEKSNRFWDKKSEVEILCSSSDCILYFEIKILNVSSKIDNSTESADGIISYTLSRKVKQEKNQGDMIDRSKEVHYGPLFLVNKNNYLIESSSQAVSWLQFAKDDYNAVQVFHFIATNSQKDTRVMFNLIGETESIFGSDQYGIKIKNLNNDKIYEYVDENSKNITWPSLTDQEYKDLGDFSKGKFLFLKNKVFDKCTENICQYAISLYMRKRPDSLTYKNSFYISLPWLQNFTQIDLTKGQSYKRQLGNEFKKNGISSNIHISINDYTYESLLIRAFSNNRGTHFVLPVYYEVFKYTGDGNDIQPLGNYYNDKFALYNPTQKANYYVVFYGNGREELNFTCEIELTANSQIEITDTVKEKKLEFSEWVKLNNFETYKVQSDEVKNINIQFKNYPDSIKDKIKFQILHCTNIDECFFPDDFNNIPEYEMTLNQSSMVYPNKDKGCGKGCVLMTKTEYEGMFTNDMQSFSVDMSITHQPIPNPDGDGGLDTWIIIVIVLSSVFVVSVVGFIGLRYYRKKKAQADNYANMEYNNDIEEEQEEEN